MRCDRGTPPGSQGSQHARQARACPWIDHAMGGGMCAATGSCARDDSGVWDLSVAPPQDFYFDAPGNIFRYLLLLNDSNLNIIRDHLACILYLIDIYKNKNDFELLDFISILIENYYNELSLYNTNNLNSHFINKYKILYLISDMKKFNLDKKNLLTTITRVLENEAQ